MGGVKSDVELTLGVTAGVTYGFKSVKQVLNRVKSNVTKRSHPGCYK